MTKTTNQGKTMSVRAGTDSQVQTPCTYVYLGDCYINNATHNNQGVKRIPCITEIVLHGAEKPRKGEREKRKKKPTKEKNKTKRKRKNEKKKHERKERREKNEKRKRLRGHIKYSLTTLQSWWLKPGQPGFRRVERPDKSWVSSKVTLGCGHPGREASGLPPPAPSTWLRAPGPGTEGRAGRSGKKGGEAPTFFPSQDDGRFNKKRDWRRVKIGN